MRFLSPIRGVSLATWVVPLCLGALCLVASPNQAAAGTHSVAETPDAENAELRKKRKTCVDKATDLCKTSGLMPKTSVVYKNITVVRYNPLGTQNRMRLDFRRRLSDSQSVLLKNTYVSASAIAMLTPALQRVGARLELQPLAILQLYAAAEWVWYMGNFQFMASYKDAAQDYSDTALNADADNGRNYMASGTSLTIGGKLQAKIGPIAIRSDNMLQRWNMDTKRGDPVFYDPFYDLLTPADGWTWVQNNDVLYVKDRLIIGLRHTMTKSLLSDAVLAPTDKAAAPRDVHHRVGPFVLWRLTNEYQYTNKMFRRPSLVLLSQWFVQHPYRTGQDVSQAIPWFAAVLVFDGRLWGADAK